MFPTQKTNLWEKDEQNFGRKLMRKLGWKKGNGLRKNGNGVIDPIQPAQTDKKELSCGSSRCDYSWNWLSHQDDYAVLLSQLQQQHMITSESKPIDNLDAESVIISSITNLEKKRKRVHHKRSIQSKNMKNCSEADWNCILGIKRRKKIISEEPDPPMETELCQDELGVSSAAYSVNERFQMERRHEETAASEIFHSQEESEDDIPTVGDSVVDNKQELNSSSQLKKKGKKKKKNKRKRKQLEQETSCFGIKSSQGETLEEDGRERVGKENNCQAEDSLIVLRKAKKIKKKKKRAGLKTILDLTNIAASQSSETSSLENECITTTTTTTNIRRGILKSSSVVAENIKLAQKKCVSFADKPIVGFVPAKDSVRGGAWMWRTKRLNGKPTIV